LTVINIKNAANLEKATTKGEKVGHKESFGD